MTTSDPLLAARSSTDLLRLSRDALRRAGTAPGDGVPVPALVEQLGLLVEVLGDLDAVLDGTRRELRRREGAVSAVEGVFAGEPEAALTTVDLWAGRAYAGTRMARRAVENAHVASAGLADAG